MMGIFAVWQRHPDSRHLLETALATAKHATPTLGSSHLTGLSVLSQDENDYAETARYEAEVQRAAKAAA